MFKEKVFTVSKKYLKYLLFTEHQEFTHDRMLMSYAYTHSLNHYL